jgi:hypothetical protein
MIYKRLTWIAGALFLLGGLPLLVVEDIRWAHFWGGLAVFWLGAFALTMARAAVAAGQLRINFSVVRRASQPRTFWAVIALLVIAGAVVLISAFWFWFFKA